MFIDDTSEKKELKKSLPWIWIWVNWCGCWKVSLLLLAHSNAICSSGLSWGAVTRQCNSLSLFLECLLMTPQKKKELKKNHCPEFDYDSAGEVVFGRLVCYCWYTGWYVLGQLPVTGFTVKIVWYTAELCSNISVRFKIFLPETEVFCWIMFKK